MLVADADHCDADVLILTTEMIADEFSMNGIKRKSLHVDISLILLLILGLTHVSLRVEIPSRQRSFERCVIHQEQKLFYKDVV